MLISWHIVADVVRCAQVAVTGLALLQSLRRGHYELATETIRPLRIAATLAEFAHAICSQAGHAFSLPGDQATQQGLARVL